MVTDASIRNDWPLIGTVSVVSLGLLLIGKGDILPLALFSAMVLGLYLLSGRTYTLPVVFLFSGFFILQNPPGLNLGEILFYAMAGVLLLFVVIPDVMKANLKIENAIDVQFFLLFVMIAYGIGMAFLQRNSMYTMLVDGSIYVAILGYFPFRNYMRDEKRRMIFLWVAFAVIILVCLRNFINYREIVIQATMAWQLELARSAVNEIVILFGCVIVLVLFSYSDSLRKRVAYGGLLGFLLMALILTQSRGFWITFLISTFIFLYFADTKQRVFAISLISTILAVLVAVVVILFYDQMEFIIYGFNTRILSLFKAGQDVSLMERVVEGKNVFQSITENPVAGYGLGKEYIRHNMLFGNVYKNTFYIHNGYLSVWFKFGIFGLILNPLMYATITWYALKCFRQHPIALYRQIALGIACTLPAGLILNMTSPLFTMFDGLFCLTIAGAFVSSIYMDIKDEKPTVT
jgi:O-antigen ligase